MKKRYQDMTTEELAAATREFDRPGTIQRTRPMTASERAEERRARRLGRPKIGKGSERINISIERDLLAQTDEAAKRYKIGRSEMIAKSLRLALKAS